MKMKKSWLLAPASIGLAAVCYAFFGPPPPPPSLTVSLSSGNVATFTPNDLPVPSGTGASTWLLLSHGDGTYFMGTPSQLSAHSHQYTPGSTYHPFLEYVEVYDDNKKPPGRTAVSVSISSGTAPTEAPTLIPSNNIRLQRSTNPVPGDSVTYIITYENMPDCASAVGGKIKFTYDNTVFEYGQTDNYFQEGAATVSSSGSSTTREISFTNLPAGGQRNFFIRLKTKDGVDTNRVLNPATHVELALDKGASDLCWSTTPFTDTITGERVLASHDPNFKTVVKNDLCRGDSVTWRIDFQNTGNAMEDSVVVADWIDTIFEFNSVTLIDSKFPVSSMQWRPGTREVRFAMFPITLHGLGEPALLKEEDTRGYVILRAKKRQIYPYPKCSAAANAARIFFGCNPPVFTETALASYACDTINCTPCSIMVDTFLPAAAIPPSPGGPVISSVQLTSLLGDSLSGWNFKWYPTAGLDNPLTAVPNVTSPVNRTYTLVASYTGSVPSCSQAVIRVPVAPAHRLQMTATPVLSANSNCPNAPKWSVRAKVAGKDTLNLVWNNCTYTGRGTWYSPEQNLDPSNYYVSVWDTLSDDYVETWVRLPMQCNNTGSGGSLPAWLRYLLYGLGATLLLGIAYRLLKRK